METKTINSQIEELKKGEGITKEEIVFILEQIYKKGFVGRILDNPNDNLICYYDLFSFLSKAKLSTLQEAQKMFLEEIKSMRKHKDTKLIHNFNGEEIDYLISAKELKSKIGGEDD